MLSVRSLVTGLLATTLVQLALAAPVPAAAVLVTDCDKPTPTIPSSGNTPDLPTTNLTLQYVAIGRGIQNYTCAAASATPVAIGAIANLYDVTALTYLSQTAVHAIPPLAVYMPTPGPGATLAMKAAKLNPIGKHYFNSAGVPTFDLSSVKKIFYGARTGDVLAPSTANKGPSGTGAVDWLQLSPKASYTNVGISLVYRVETAGGAPTVCGEAKAFSEEYAAEYWFYN